MTRGLVAVFLVVESIDLALYLQAPHFEGGPMGSLPPSARIPAPRLDRHGAPDVPRGTDAG